MQSQQTPFLGQGSYVQLQFFKFLSLLHSILFSFLINQYSIPFLAFTPLEKACFTSRISVTVSAISRSSRGAFLPVSTMQSFLGLFFIRLIVSSIFKSPYLI